MRKVGNFASGRVKTSSLANLDPNRREYLSLENAEPHIGAPSQPDAIIVSHSDGTRRFAHFDSNFTISNTDITLAANLVQTITETSEAVANASLQSVTDVGATTTNSITLDGSNLVFNVGAYTTTVQATTGTLGTPNSTITIPHETGTILTTGVGNVIYGADAVDDLDYDYYVDTSNGPKKLDPNDALAGLIMVDEANDLTQDGAFNVLMCQTEGLAVAGGSTLAARAVMVDSGGLTFNPATNQFVSSGSIIASTAVAIGNPTQGYGVITTAAANADLKITANGTGEIEILRPVKYGLSILTIDEGENGLVYNANNDAGIVTRYNNEANVAITDLQSGTEYQIVFAGTSTWSTVGGPATPTIGAVFTATGAGTGDGIAVPTANQKSAFFGWDRSDNKFKWIPDATVTGTGASQTEITGAVGDAEFKNLTLTGDLVVQGNTVTVEATTLTVEDPIIFLGNSNNSVDDNLDRGIAFSFNDGSPKQGFMGWDDSESSFVLYDDVSESNGVITKNAFGEGDLLVAGINSRNSSTIAFATAGLDALTIGGAAARWSFSTSNQNNLVLSTSSTFGASDLQIENSETEKVLLDGTNNNIKLYAANTQVATIGSNTSFTGQFQITSENNLSLPSNTPTLILRNSNTTNDVVTLSYQTAQSNLTLASEQGSFKVIPWTTGQTLPPPVALEVSQTETVINNTLIVKNSDPQLRFIDSDSGTSNVNQGFITWLESNGSTVTGQIGKGFSGSTPNDLRFANYDAGASLMFSVVPVGTSSLINALEIDDLGQVKVLRTTAATSDTTGALTVAGGFSVQGDVHFGGNLTVTAGTNAQVEADRVKTSFVFGPTFNENSTLILQASNNTRGVTISGGSITDGAVQDAFSSTSGYSEVIIQGAANSVTGLNSHANTHGGQVIVKGGFSGDGYGGDVEITGGKGSDFDNDTRGGNVRIKYGDGANDTAGRRGNVYINDQIFPQTAGSTGEVLKVANSATGQLEWGTDDNTLWSIAAEDNTDTDRYITFVDSQTGGQTGKTDTALKYNSSKNNLTAGNFSATDAMYAVNGIQIGGTVLSNMAAAVDIRGSLGQAGQNLYMYMADGAEGGFYDGITIGPGSDYGDGSVEFKPTGVPGDPSDTLNQWFHIKDAVTPGTTKHNLRVDGEIVTGSDLTAENVTVNGQASIDDLLVPGGTISIGTANSSLTSTILGNGTLTIDPAPVAGDANGTVIIKGDLQVDGTTTTVNSTEVTIEDRTLTLAYSANTYASANGTALLFGTNPAGKLPVWWQYREDIGSNYFYNAGAGLFPKGSLYTLNNIHAPVGISTIITYDVSRTSSANSLRTYRVTTSTKTSGDPYFGDGGTTQIVIDGFDAPGLDFKPYVTYRFDQSDASNSGHQIQFYLDRDRTISYNTDVTVVGTPGTSGAYTEIAVTVDTPTQLWYHSANSSRSGNFIEVQSHSLLGFDTDDLTEGSTNLYFTEARARSSFTQGTGVAINSGVISIGQDVASTQSPIFSGLTLNGNLLVNPGVSNQITAPKLNLTGPDETLVFNADLGASAPVDDIKLVVNRGSATDAYIEWDEANDRWNIGDGTNVGTIHTSYSTDIDAATFDGQAPSYYLNYNNLTNTPQSLLDFNIADGTAGQVLQTDGNGNFSFTTITGANANTASGGGGYSAVQNYSYTSAGSATFGTETNKWLYVQVFVNGVALASSQYSFDVASGIVTLTNAPQTGAEVEVWAYNTSIFDNVDLISVANTGDLTLVNADLYARDVYATGEIHAGLSKTGTAVFNVSANTATNTFNYVSNDYVSAKLTIHVRDNSLGEEQVQEALILTNGSTPMITTYATIYSGTDPLAEFDAVAANGSTYLEVTRATNNNSVIKVQYTLLES